MNNKIKVYVEGVGEVYIDKESTLEDLSKQVFENDYRRYLGARINNEIYPLYKKIEEKMCIKFLDNKDEDGHRIYIRTISSVFIMACEEVFPDCTVKIEYSLGKGLYAELEKGKSISFKEIELIKLKMRELVEKDIKIIRKEISTEEALLLFEEFGDENNIRLYNTIEHKKVQLYRIGDHIDRFHGYLTPSTSYVNVFDLKYYYPGAIILFPTIDSNNELSEFKEQKKLSKVFKGAKEWTEISDLDYVGSLNEKIINKDINESIMMSEALHEKKIAEIADEICKDDDIHIILIAGPSSSGKTTFAQRLGVHLRVNGKRPVAISADNYFVDRENTPLNEKGEYDFESLEAINLKQFNEDLVKLLEGEQIELPKFNFIEGVSEKSGIKIKVDKDHPIIVEGIHGLNPRLATYIPEKNKFKIYISALTQLNLDAHNRISTTDTRLIRRMVRDNKYRGNDVFRTFELWKGVVEGERKNIFPFQEEADIMFDSSLVYELSVLKKHAIPLLEQIDSSSIYYSESKRLLRFLSYFQDIEDEKIIPSNSILREFIGGAGVNIH